MPITCNVKINPIAKDDFYSLDYKVMGLTFAIHQKLGRFWDEAIYQSELAYQFQKTGLAEAALEVPIQVSYHDFTKFYYMDLLLNNAVLYELKTVLALAGEHHKQALNYLLLTGMRHGKLINMRPSSVESRFVSTNITPAKRYEFSLDETEWQDLDEDSVSLKRLVVDLLNDWGAFLSTDLFYDAVIHFRGGEENVVKEIEVVDNGRLIGKQEKHLLNPKTAFNISAVTRHERQHAEHLRRMIRHTNLKAVQWVNFNHDLIAFRTLFP
ncbi:GxxExxY protein [candidate division KSB1 bacterium]|nr:GxxExxY protein [candidate division KSB1 bacterium]